MRELKAALKSRPMRRLKDLQKRKYDTSLLLLGVHSVRMELGIRTRATLELFEMEPSNDNTRLDSNENVDDTMSTEGKFVASQGTDSFPLNTLQPTKDY